MVIGLELAIIFSIGVGIYTMAVLGVGFLLGRLSKTPISSALAEKKKELRRVLKEKKAEKERESPDPYQDADISYERAKASRSLLGRNK